MKLEGAFGYDVCYWSFHEKLETYNLVVVAKSIGEALGKFDEWAIKQRITHPNGGYDLMSVKFVGQVIM